MQAKNLSVLLSKYEAFCEQHPNLQDDFSSFGRYISEAENSTKGKVETDFKSYSENEDSAINGNISALLLIMARFASMYGRKVFDQENMVGFGDFAFLMQLFTQGSMSKMGLIESCLYEKSGGMEIIKRLLSKDLISQIEDPEDKRSKKLSITENGKACLYQHFPGLNQIGSLVMGNLNYQEKETLLGLLQKLEHFHRPIYHFGRELSWDEILKKYKPDSGE